MSPLLGLSSGSAARLDADALARLTLELGGSAVDVRAGKGHGWETDGAAAGLRTLRSAGVEVSFLGIGTVLGAPAREQGPAPDDDEVLERGTPVKVFAAAGCTRPEHFDLTRRQIDALAARTGSAGTVLVETHHGFASVEELVELCASTGINIVLDTFGLARIHQDPVEAAARLAPWVFAAQVKGFDQDRPEESAHLPLASSCAEPTRQLLARIPGIRSLTVESKAGSLAADLALLREWFPDPEGCEP